MNPTHAHTATVSIGLIAWLNNTRIVLPLKGVEARYDVRGDLVSVELCQVYHQNHAEPLDVLYTFPLPGGAAVYRCEMIVNDRVIAAKVMEVEEARKVAAEKKAAGHRTALVESVTENLFELALGNLAPGDTIIIRLSWFQTLDTSGHDRSCRIPFTPGVRYIPGSPLLRSNTGKGGVDDTDQVPDASRLTPPRIDQFHPDAAWASIEGRIQFEGVDAAHIASPSHTLILRDADGAVTARLAGTGEVPDRDFVLRLPASAPDVLTPAAWITREEGHTHALVRIIAPATAPATLCARDVYFLVDRSGSMSGDNWTATCKVFRSFLSNLAPQDRAWVTFFESAFQDLAEKPLPPAAILNERIVQKLESWAVGGGTELLPALDHVLTALRKHSAQRSPVIVIITDGQVGNEETIIERMTSHPDVRVYCYGIDRAVNDAFLRRLATQQRGACSLVTPQDDLVGTVAGLASRLRHPVFTGLRPPDGWELPAGAIPDLHAGECLSVSLRGPACKEISALQFPAHDGNGAPAFLTCPVCIVNDAAIAKLWAKERIEFLLAEDNRDAAVQLSVSANIVCQHTAFIAWDEAERLARTGPNREIYQPAFEPAGAAGGVRGGAKRSRVMRKMKQAVLSAPIIAVDKISKMRAVAMAMSEDLSRPPTDEELKEECGIERAVVAQFRAAAAACPAPAPAFPPPPPTTKAGAPGAKQADERFQREADKAISESSPDDTCEFPAQYIADHFDAAVCAGPSEQLIRSAGAEAWRQKLSALTNITLPDALLDWLEQWVLSDPAKSSARRKLLEDLAALLVKNKSPLDALTGWLAAHLEPAFRAPVLRELAAMGAPA